MQTFTTLTLLFALSGAVPHALNHFKLHERALHADAALALKPLVERDLPTTDKVVKRQTTYNLLTGQCGGTSGFGCAPGLCCSQYGFCGSGPQYCGSGGGGGAPAFGRPAGGPPPQYRPPQGPPPQGPPAQGPPSQAPPFAPAPSAPVPAPSAPPSQPSSPPTQPSAAPNVPSAAPNVPSSPPAAPSAPAQPSAAPVPSSAPSSAPNPPTGGSGGGLGNVYKFYTGDGAPAVGWPAQTEWMDFESLWAANLPTIGISCSQFGEKNNSPEESNELKSAVQSVGASSGIDPRFILAVVMQESKGCVRVITTDNGVVNPGLMQSHDGTGSCNPGGDGSPASDPCPSSQIVQMIKDGTEGTASGDGLKQVLSQCTATDVAQRYYQAGVIYNSGNLPQNLDDNTATPCYASDIANRLTGWTTAMTSCTI